jgi:hypothetical protein
LTSCNNIWWNFGALQSISIINKMSNIELFTKHGNFYDIIIDSWGETWCCALNAQDFICLLLKNCFYCINICLKLVTNNNGLNYNWNEVGSIYRFKASFLIYSWEYHILLFWLNWLKRKMAHGYAHSCSKWKNYTIFDTA